jgi:phosphohistidine phosphatase
MQVLLVRHADATDTGSASSDYDRWLTESGRQTMTKVGEELSSSGLRYTRIYTSPLVRAVQTAEILAATAPAFDGPVEVQRALSTEEGTTAQALSPLEDAEQGALIVMVTHMPKVGVLASHLGRLASAPGFRTGAACLITLDGANGRVEWMLDPSTLARRRP